MVTSYQRIVFAAPALRDGDSHLDNLDQLIHAAVSWEYWLSEQQLSQNAARWPDVNVCRVICGAENELGGAIIPRADIRHVGLSADQLLGTGQSIRDEKGRRIGAKRERLAGQDKKQIFFFFPSFLLCVKTWSLPAKVAQLEDGSFRVHQQVLGLDVSVAHTLGMDVGQAAKQLVHVHLKGQSGLSIGLMGALERLRWKIRREEK